VLDFYIKSFQPKQGVMKVRSIHHSIYRTNTGPIGANFMYPNLFQALEIVLAQDLDVDLIAQAVQARARLMDHQLAEGAPQCV
jgi:hypothetical protein